MDTLLIGQLEGGLVRAYLAETTQVCETARSLHDFSPTAAVAVGRALTGTLFMGNMLKNAEDRVTTTFTGDGDLGRIICVAKASGDVKGYCDYPHAGEGCSVGEAVGKGYLTVIKDMGMGEPYIGRVPLKSGEIAEDFAWYFAKSEQTPCLMSLGVSCDANGVSCAGGLFLQPMPGCPDHVLDNLEGKDFSRITAGLREAGSVEALWEALFSDLQAEILETRNTTFACGCSRERLETVLLGIGEEELLDIIEKDGQAEMVCSFCNTKYHFDEAQLRALLASAKQDKNDG